MTASIVPAVPAAELPTQATWPRTLALLCSRIVLFALAQTLIFLALRLVDPSTTWEDAAPYWAVAATLANVVSIGLLAWAMRREGKRLVDAYHFQGGPWLRDLLLTLLVMVGAGVLAILPNIGVATAIFGDPMIPVNRMFQPLPQWAVLVSLILFPLTIPFSEMPTYFGYCMPRLEYLSRNRWFAVIVASLALAAQHCTLPLLFDANFILWRFLMFLPLALYVGLILRWRLRLLPYVMALHGLLDLQAGLMIFMLSQGQ